MSRGGSRITIREAAIINKFSTKCLYKTRLPATPILCYAGGSPGSSFSQSETSLASRRPPLSYKCPRHSKGALYLSGRCHR